MAVGEGRTFSAPHGVRWFSNQVNKNFTRKEKKLKKDKKLSNFEAFSNIADRKSATKSTQGLFPDYERLQFSRHSVRSSVEKPPRIRRRTSNTSLLDMRLSEKKSENLDYSYVFVEETDLEKSTRERLMHEVKQQNWMENETKDHRESPLSSRSLSQRKPNTVTQDCDKKFGTRSLVSFNPKPQHCNRLVHTDRGEFSKQFCDVLGPGLCADCTRSQMQQFVIDEHTRNFPNICVSPYVLCAPQESERDVKTPFSIYKECDPLQRRRPSTFSPTRNIGGLKTRPNSSSNERACLHDSTGSDCFLAVSSPSESPVRIETLLSSHCSSRRSSISRYLMDSKNEVLREKEAGSDEEGKTSVFTSSRRVRIFPAPQSPGPENKNEKQYVSDRLDPNCFNKRKTGSRSTTRSSVCKTPSISRTGKLSELPYWKFLIPEPPMMVVERMNVSIYTPKQIPGIKIFDESFFDI